MIKQNSLLVKRLAAVIQHTIDDDSEENTSGILSLPSMQKEKNYVSTYLEYYPSPQADENSLAWWKLERTVSKLRFFAKKYLCFWGTSVPSERILSSAGHISNSLHNRLSLENDYYQAIYQKHLTQERFNCN